MKHVAATFKAAIAACQKQGVRIEYPDPETQSFFTRYHRAKSVGRTEAELRPDLADKYLAVVGRPKQNR